LIRSQSVRRSIAPIATLLLASVASGCATPGMQGIEADLDRIQEQMFRVQKENAVLSERIAEINEAALTPTPDAQGPSGSELGLRLDALERDLASLVTRQDQTDHRLAALVQDLRTTREALQTLLRSLPEEPPAAAGAGSAGSPGPSGGPQAPGGTETAGVQAPLVAATGGVPANVASSLVMEDLFRQGYIDYTKGNYALALQELTEFVGRNPESDLADDAQYLIGEVHFSQQQFSQAVEAFDVLVQTYPGGDKAGPAYLKKGLALLEMNRTADAVIQLQHVVTAYPRSEEARIASDRLRGLGLSER